MWWTYGFRSYIYILAFTNIPKKINNSKLKLRIVQTYYYNAKKNTEIILFANCQ